MPGTLALPLVQYGVAGVAVIAMLLTFRTITREQKRSSIRKNFIRILWIYVSVSAGFLVLLLLLEVLRMNQPVDAGTLRECRSSLNSLNLRMSGAETDKEKEAIVDGVNRTCKVLFKQIDASL